MAWKEEKVKWISQGHLSRFYFPLNNIRKMDTNNVNHKPDKGSKRQYIRQGKGIRRSTWKKFIGPLNNNIITTVALNIQYLQCAQFYVTRDILFNFTIILSDKHYIFKNRLTNEANNGKQFNITQGGNVKSCNLNPDLTPKAMRLTPTSFWKILKQNVTESYIVKILKI